MVAQIINMEYYIIVNNAKQGPFSLEELAQKNVTAQTLVWRKGLDDWMKAEELEELNDLLNQMPPETPKQPAYPPKTWLVEAILVTCLCCLPLGIVGIVYATKVESNFYSKQYDMALYYSEQAKRWTLWGFFLTIGLGALYLLFIFFFAIAGVAFF